MVISEPSEEALGQVGLPLCLRNHGSAFNDLADSLVRTGLYSWQNVSALCASDIVFSEFLPVFEPRNDCVGGQGTCFPPRT